jgi:hypothetical protein
MYRSADFFDSPASPPENVCYDDDEEENGYMPDDAQIEQAEAFNSSSSPRRGRIRSNEGEEDHLRKKRNMRQSAPIPISRRDPWSSPSCASNSCSPPASPTHSEKLQIPMRPCQCRVCIIRRSCKRQELHSFYK